MTELYFPVLKGKRGEFRAVSDVAGVHSKYILPTFDIVPLSENGTPEKVSASISKVVRYVDTYLSDKPRIALDVFDFMPDWRGQSGSHPIEEISNAMTAISKQFTLGIGLDRDKEYWDCAIRNLRSPQSSLNALFLRFQLDDIETPDMCFDELKEVLDTYECLDAVQFIVLDLRYISTRKIKSLASICSEFLTHPNFPQKPFVVLSGAIPLSISELLPKSESNDLFDRLERKLWRKINAAIKDHGLKALYGDYGVVHPEYRELDPRLLANMGPKIKYTLRSKIYVSRGKSFRTHDDGYDQYITLARRLVRSGYFSGRGYSSGDEFIDDVASGTKGAGNQESWVYATTNHHLTKAVRVLRIESK